ncbi:MAG: Flagellar basal body rod protein FlgB [Planctomycetota bacterium]|jgi:flagellar basal-body rod protein FlgB
MVDGFLGNSALPALERSLQFMSARQRLLATNLANAETPGFRPVDVDPRAFQGALREALDEGRLDGQGRLAFDDSAPVSFTGGDIELKPEVLADNILFHDGNDRSLERLMQRMTENVYAFRAASQLMRNQFELINTAIRERP